MPDDTTRAVSEIVCEGCGVTAPGPEKPPKWYQRTDAETGVDHYACTRACIDVIAEKTGQTKVIMPW